MHPTALAFTFLAVMGAALACFWRAFSTRKTTPVHKRWGIAGTAIDLAGTGVVIAVTRGLGWHVPARDDTVAAVHRGFAYVATALVLLVAGTGIAKAQVHKRLWIVFLPVYNATYALAAWAYAPLP